MTYVIIGNSAAGLACAETVRLFDKRKKLMIVADEPYPAYSRCLTSYLLEGSVSEEKIYLRQNVHYDRLGIELKKGVRIADLDPDEKELKTADGKKICYEKLLIATGAAPKFPQIKGIDSKGVFGLRTLEDARKIASLSRSGGSAVVLGGGLVSIKSATALKARGMEVIMLISSGQVMSRVLDKEAARMIERELELLGIRVMKGTDAVEIITDDKKYVREVRLKKGDSISADLVVVGKGVIPNTSFLRKSGLVQREGEPLKVTRKQETKLPGIYAAGDVSLSYDFLEEGFTHNAIWPAASEQGKIAGFNMVGKDILYRGSIKMNSVTVGKLPVVTAGITNPDDEYFKIVSEGGFQRGYYKKFVINNRRLVGFILVGEISRAGIYTGLIRSGKKIDSLKRDLVSTYFQPRKNFIPIG